MKTFTARELDRRPVMVLDMCDREGAVRVRRRDGRNYTLRPDNDLARKGSRADRRKWLADHFRWLASTFPKPVSKEQNALVERIIGGG
jgi:hypothetical protein